jgi:hypothetical protein
MASGVPVVARDEGGPSEIVADGKSGFLVPPHDLDGFVEKVLKLGDPLVRETMGIESRRMAEEATWEKINSTVAWKLAEALGTQLPTDTTPKPTSDLNFSIPIYSWLLLSPELRSVLGSLIVDARLVGGLWMIIGVWFGLVVTWILVQATLMMRSRSPWMSTLMQVCTR